MSSLAARLRNSRQVAGLRETWNRLNRIDLKSRPVVLGLLFAHFATIFTFEVGRIPNQPLLVVAVAMMAEVFFWACFLSMQAVHVAIDNPKTRALINLFILFLANTLRVIFLEFGYLQFGLIEEVTIGDRILGDSTGIVLIMVGVAYVQVVVTELGKQEQALEEAGLALLESGRSSRDRARMTDLQLRSKAQQVLGSQLIAISEHLESAKAGQVKALTREIRELIENKVRPLSAELWSQLSSIEDQKGRTDAIGKSRLPKAITPALDFRGSVIFAYAGLNIFVTTPGLSNWLVAMIFGLVTITFPFLAELIGRIYPRQWHHSLFPGMVVVSGLALLAWSPSLAFLFLESPNHPNLSVLALTSSLLIVIAANGVAVWSAFKRERTSYLARIDELNKHRSRQLALLQQAVWVARRRWTFLIHGTVQGALTVALARLQLSKSLTDSVRTQVIADVERAKNALEGDERFSQDWQEILLEIRQTWERVCDLQIEVEGKAEAKLAVSRQTSVCLAEITKEIVSNAFRHGRASKVLLKISLDQFGDIRLVATNNGKPVSKTRKPGVGHEMLEELTTSWSWKNTASGPRLTATIPVPN